MNTLLHTSTLAPTGQSSLCAVRFSSAVKVHKIRIHDGEEDSLVLDVYFNCQLVPTPSEPKPKATNALVPTRIAHAGGTRDYYVNMTPQYTTKLMIIKGDFSSLRISVYGTVYAPSSPPAVYTPRASTSSTAASALPSSLDPARSEDPLYLGQQLLSLTSEPPAMPLVVKFALCHDLHEELNGPDAPQLYTDLKECLESLDLGFDWIRNAAETTRRPISEHVSEDVLKSFAERVQDSLYDKDEDQAHVLSQLLYNTACQSSSVADLFTTMWDPDILSDVFTSSMTRTALLNLFMAAASRDVALYLRKGTFLSTVADIQGNPQQGFGMKKLARDLLSRVQGWEQLGDSDTSDYGFIVPWIQRMISHEASLGIFLLSIFSCPGVLETFIDLPSVTLASEALGFTDLHLLGRALVGVGAVLAALAWADAADEPAAASSTLAILRLWQARTAPDDYGTLVRQTIILPRLFNMVDALLAGDTPSPARHDAEAVVLALLADKASAVQPHVWARVADPDAPVLFSLSHDAAEAMADLVCDGLPAALRVLDAHRQQSDDRRVLFALEIVRHALDADGAQAVRAAAWAEDVHGVQHTLVDMLDVTAHTLLRDVAPSPALTLLETAAAVLHALPALLDPFSLPAHATRTLVRALVSLVSAARSLQARYAKLVGAAYDVVGAADTLMRVLSDVSRESPLAGKSALRGLAEAVVPECATDDPVARIGAVGDLLDACLPREADARWVREVALPVLPQVRELVGALVAERKAQALLRLLELDSEDLGLADWIIAEELQVLERAAVALDAEEHHHEDTPVDPRMALVRAHVGLAFEWIARVAEEGGEGVHWDEQALARAMVVLVDADLVGNDGPVVRAARALAPTEATLQFATALVLLGDGERGLSKAAQLLDGMHGDGEPDPPHLAKLSLRAGCALCSLAQGVDVSDDTCAAVQLLLKWMLDRHNDFQPFVLLGISEHTFTGLVALFPESSRTSVEDIRSQMRFDADSIPAFAAPDLLAPIRLAPSQLAAALFPAPAPAPPIPTPSTPPRASRNTAAAILELATVSPPASLLRSPQVTGLTKTYQNNDFRQLRSVPAGRVNTSRLPSLHVDDFEHASQSSVPSPTIPSPQRAMTPAPGLQFGGHLPYYPGSQQQF